MKNIEVAVLNECGGSPAGMMMFLAKLTQRGHSIKCMADLQDLFCKTMVNPAGADKVVDLPHSTIKRFSPITIAVVGASRRFLAQARTHQVGITYVSASLQYSDYSDQAQFVVPYAIIEKGANAVVKYLEACNRAMETYKEIAEMTDNDTAGYIAPQGLSNILIIQGNHESWMHFIRTRSCNRNTNETQYVTYKIWEALVKTIDGELMFSNAGPDCLYGKCREGKMCCGDEQFIPGDMLASYYPTHFLEERWPLLYGN